MLKTSQQIASQTKKKIDVKLTEAKPSSEWIDAVMELLERLINTFQGFLREDNRSRIVVIDVNVERFNNDDALSFQTHHSYALLPHILPLTPFSFIEDASRPRRLRSPNEVFKLQRL